MNGTKSSNPPLWLDTRDIKSHTRKRPNTTFVHFVKSKLPGKSAECGVLLGSTCCGGFAQYRVVFVSTSCGDVGIKDEHVLYKWTQMFMNFSCFIDFPRASVFDCFFYWDWHNVFIYLFLILINYFKWKTVSIMTRVGCLKKKCGTLCFT